LKRSHSLKTLAASLLLGFLAACSTTQGTRPQSPELTALYETRLQGLLELDQWALEGRLAVNNGKDGGSGNFNWRELGNETTMSFHGAFGRGAWRLEAEPGKAILQLADGEVYRASSSHALVEQALGWEVPVDALAWWVRGLAAPGAWTSHEFDEDGKFLALNQFGWDIEFARYLNVNGMALPQKMTARQGASTVKLAIRKWNLDADRSRND